MSEGYLAHFTGTGTSKGFLSVFDLQTSRFFLAKPRNVACELDYNRISVRTLAPDAFEKALGRFESDAIREIRNICRTGKLPPTEMFSYAYNLLMLFAVKAPPNRRAMTELQTSTYGQLLRIWTSSREIFEARVKDAQERGFIRPDADLSFERSRDALRRGAFKVSIPTDAHILTEISIFDELLPLVSQRYWSVMNVQAGAPDLITCDRPAPPVLGDGQIIFTLSPRCALLGDQEDPSPDDFEIDAEAVGRINARLVNQATRQIYSRTSRVTLMNDDRLVTCDLKNIPPSRPRG